MAIQPEPIRMTLEQFLAWEPQQPFSEGLIYATAGASRAHGQIAANLVALVRPSKAEWGAGCTRRT